jgi:hypothetical protein
VSVISVHRLAAGVGLAILLSCLGQLHAQTVSVTGDGLTVTAESWNMNTAGGGYCPVRIQVSNMSKNQRSLRVVIESQIHLGGLEVAQNIDLDPSNAATGASKADFTLSVPITSAYLAGSLKVYEHGRELKKLRSYGLGGAYWWGSQPMPNVLNVGRSSPDMRNLTEAVAKISFGTGAAVQPNYQPLTVKPEQVPTKWIDFTMLDMLLVSVKDLEQLPAPSRDAIAQWTLAGGNLFVYGLGEDRENSPDLKRLLDLDRRPPHNANWREPKVEERNTEPVGQAPTQVMRTPTGQRVRVATASAAPTSSGAASPDTSLKPKSEIVAHFAVRPFGLGLLVACSTDDPFPGQIDDWAWVLKSLGPHRVQWHERHGMSAHGENDDFWNFLIPGVGKAPVGGFQVLITLFALAIGPVNYFVLQRRKKLYLLIVTVPVFAGITTVLLLGYAVASDGFALRSRVRSVTLLDQVRGESVSWSRISYYAGVAPSGGLRFSPDTAVYPLDPPGSSGAQRSVDWTDGQHMQSGWLRSRTPTQLVTVAYRQGGEQIEVASSSTGVVRVTNKLGTNIRLLVLAAADGTIYSTQDLPRDESIRLEPKDLADAQIALRKLADGQRLEVPAEMTDRDLWIGPTSRRTMYWRGSFVPQWQNSIGEGIFQVIQPPNADKLKELLQPGTYLAITDQPPTVDLGVTNMQDEGSLYVIVGVY